MLVGQGPILCPPTPIQRGDNGHGFLRPTFLQPAGVIIMLRPHLLPPFEDPGVGWIASLPFRFDLGSSLEGNARSLT